MNLDSNCKDLNQIADYCGNKSSKKMDKFSNLN